MRLNMDDGGDIAVDMGPLIDCVFLLLIFFLVSTTMKRPEMEMPVELPDPAISAKPNTDKQPTIITIDRKGSFEGLKNYAFHTRSREMDRMK